MTRVHATVGDLLDELAGGRPWRLEPSAKHVDSLSGSPFELATIGDERYLVKHIAADVDWIMRDLGDGADGRPPWALVLWQEGILDRLPPEIDHLIVGMAYDAERAHLHQVMRYEPDGLVPAGPEVVPLRRHRQFLSHMAALHATFWGFTDQLGLLTSQRRYGFAAPSFTEREAAAGRADPVPQMFPGGWAAVRAAAPEAAELALRLVVDPSPLATAMADGPATFVHGDWKFGNLGAKPDGRTILLDWAWPGAGGPGVDLAWYLAVNCDRLPESKEDTIAAYRMELERRAIATGAWWDRQLELALVGAFLQLGWSKPGNPHELAWWTDRVGPTMRSLR
jgi:hypothetical protein